MKAKQDTKRVTAILPHGPPRCRDRDTERIERAGADVTVDDADAADCQCQLARASIRRVPTLENNGSCGIGHETEARLLSNVLRL
jgi:hypothetical protein